MIRLITTLRSRLRARHPERQREIVGDTFDAIEAGRGLNTLAQRAKTTRERTMLSLMEETGKDTPELRRVLGRVG